MRTNQREAEASTAQQTSARPNHRQWRYHPSHRPPANRPTPTPAASRPSRAMSRDSRVLPNLDRAARRSRATRPSSPGAASRGNPHGALRARGSQPAPGRTSPSRNRARAGRAARGHPLVLNPRKDRTHSPASLGRGNPTSPHPAVGRSSPGPPPGRLGSSPSRPPHHSEMPRSATPHHAQPRAPAPRKAPRVHPADRPHRATHSPQVRRHPACSGPRASPCPTSPPASPA